MMASPPPDAQRTALASANLVAALCGAHLLAFFDRSLFAAIAPLIQASLRLSDTALGALLGPAFALVYGIAALALGRLVDRGWTRVLLLGGLATWILAAAGLGLAASTGEVVAVRVLLGLGQAAFIPCALSLLATATQGDAARGGPMLSRFTAASSLGRSLGLFAAGAMLWLLGGWGIAPLPDGWRWLCAISLLPGLLLLAWLARRLPPAIAPTRGGQRRRVGRAVIAACLMAVPPVLTIQALAMWLPTLVVRNGLASVAAAPLIVGLVNLVSAPAGQLAGGWLIARSAWCRAHPGAVVLLALTAAVPCVTAIGAAGTLPLLAFAAVAANLLLGVSSFAALAGAQAVMPPARRGELNGIFLALVTAAGTGGGPLLAGIVSDIGAGGHLGIALPVVAAGAALLAASCLILTPRAGAAQTCPA